MFYDDSMNTPIYFMIDSKLQEEASKVFENAGIDMSAAVNLFFFQCVMQGKIPFSTEMPPNTNNQYFASKIGTAYQPEPTEEKDKK